MQINALNKIAENSFKMYSESFGGYIRIESFYVIRTFFSRAKNVSYKKLTHKKTRNFQIPNISPIFENRIKYFKNVSMTLYDTNLKFLATLLLDS